MDYQRLADTVLRNQILLRVDNDSRFGVVAQFRSPLTGRVSLIKLLKNPGMSTKFILDKIASGLVLYFHPGLLAMIIPPRIPYGLFPYSANSKLLAFETFDSDLSQLIAQKIEEKTHFTEAQLRTMLRKLVSTLHFLGANNLYHGNISPETILLINGNCKIVPSLFFEEAGTICSLKTSPYSPPENFAIRKNGGPMVMRDPHKADIFSLGVTLLHAALLDEFVHVQKKGPIVFDDMALTKNLSKLSPKYSVTLVIILQRMTSPNVENRPDLTQLSELLYTLNDPVTIPGSLTNSVSIHFSRANRSDPGNSFAGPGPLPMLSHCNSSRMESVRPPPVVTGPPKVAHLTIDVAGSPVLPTPRSNSAKLPVMKSSPCKPIQHKWIASPPHIVRSATEKHTKNMAQSQRAILLTRMETVAEIDKSHIMFTETTPDKNKSFKDGFGEIPEVNSIACYNRVAEYVAESHVYAAESQVLANSIVESRVCSDNTSIGALKDLFNFFPQLRNSALKDAPLVENSMVGQLTFSTAMMKHRLVDKDVNKSGEKGAESVEANNEVAPMAESSYYQEGASPSSPYRRNFSASYAESRSNSEESVPTVSVVREQYKDGSVYEGEKQFGKRHGTGQFSFKSGGMYKGAWFNGKMTGKGTLLYPDGSTAYEGDWLEGKFHGRGTLYNEVKQDLKASCMSTYYLNFDDSSSWVTYEGGFSYDLREGTGIITFTDDSRFEGNFKGDKIDGYGKMYLASGEICEGIWIENRLNQILNASPSNRGLDTPTPGSTRSRLSQRSPRTPRMSPGSPSLGMMGSPLAGSNRSLNLIPAPTEPLIKPKAC